MVVCPRCGEQNPERFRLCGFCGASLATPGRARRKLATLLFCDLSGSTAMGERLDAESVRDFMSQYFREMRGAIERHGGTVEKFVGDAVMAVFGVPIAHEDDALRAVRAAAEMQQRFTALGEEFERRHGRRVAIRVGVNSGEVVTSADAVAAETIVTGDAVNVAARLEQAAPPGETLLGDQTYRLTEHAVSAEPVEPLTLKGKAEPVPAYRLVAVLPPAPARRLDTEMVGREAELAALEGAFDACVREGRAGLATMLGDPGVGKSRLAAAFLDRLPADATVLVGDCPSYGEALSYGPLARAVRKAVGIEDASSPAQARARLDEAVGGRRVPERALDVFLTAIGLGDSPAPPPELAFATRSLLEALAGEGPLVLMVDDAQWAEPVFLDFLAGVTRQSQRTPIMLLCLARPELLELRPDWLDAAELHIRLEPLGSTESARVIGRILDGAELPEQLRARVIELAQGNPLFIEELLGMLIDEGLVRPGADTEIAIPATLEALLAARLDRLDRPQRDTIESAAVEGHLFHRGAVEAICAPQRRGEVPPALDALVAGDFTRPAPPAVVGDAAFRFRHAMIRDAAYRGVAKSARAELHEHLAGWLESTAGPAEGDGDELVGFHLEHAYRYRAELGLLDERAAGLARRAAERLGRAGRRGLLVRLDPAAASLLDRAASLLPEDDPLRRRLLTDLASALFLVGNYRRADAVLTEAIERARAAGDRHTLLEAELERASTRLRMNPHESPDEVVRLAETAVEVFQEQGDQARLAKAWYQIGVTLGYAQARWGEAERAFRRGLEHAAAGGRGTESVAGWTRFGLGLAAIFGPTPVPDAIRRCEEMLAAAGDNRAGQAAAMLPLGRLQASLGRFDDARRSIARARTLFEQRGLTIGAATCSLQRGEVEFLASDYLAAERELRPTHDLLARTGDRRQFAAASACLANALYGQGRYEEAERVLGGDEVEDPVEGAVEAVRRRLAGVFTMRWGGTAAKLFARRGLHERAEALARETVAIAEGSDAPVVHGDALMDLAEVLRLAARSPAETGPVVREALGLYRAKGDIASSERAERLLREIEAA